MKTTTRAMLLGSTLFASVSLVAAPAFAQNAPATPAEKPAADEAPTTNTDIVVTGSLIRNPNLASSTPVAVIGAEELALRQTNTAEQIVRDLPGAAPSIGSAVNNGNGGAAYVDLRALGNFRNVVLLDGNRIVPASSVGRVDLNNIPLALIQRVDVVTGGAATTYGADAVSGVLNFITRQDFSGVEASVSNQITGKGDGHYFRSDLTIGANFDDGRGNAVLSVGYQHSDPVYQGARQFSVNNYTSTSGNAGGSGTTVPTRFSISGLGTGAARVSGNRQINPATGALVSPVVPFNFNPYNIFQTPFERYNIYGAARYEVSDKIEVYSRGLFSKNTVSTIIAPSGTFGSSLAIPFSNPYLPAAARQTFCDNNPTFTAAGVQVAQLTVAQCNAAATATTTADPNFRYFTVATNRRTTEVGSRLSDFTTTIFDYRIGAKFAITDSIKLDINGSYGESENVQAIRNYVLTSRLRAAVFATNTTTCLAGAPNGGASITAGTGCVPVNLFGPEGSITPNQVPYLTADSTTTNFTSLAQARALLTGDLGVSSPFADSPIGFAVGAEYRKYTASQRSDTLSQTPGELGGAGGAAPSFTGGYNVKEGYGELNIPVVTDKPFFKSLTVEGGIRYSDYKVDAAVPRGYSTLTYKGGATWEPLGGLRIRGTYQRAVRAPNIGELFAPVSTGLTNLSFDACAGLAPTTNANLRAVCLAQGAPAASIGNINTPTAAQANITSGGNINLNPEKSDSYTLGVVFQPNFVPGLSISIDYYNISINQAISQLTAGAAYNLCFGDRAGAGITAASVTNPNCLSIRRNPATGALDGDPATTGGLSILPGNAGKVLTDGIDLTANYRRDLGFAKLNLAFLGNWTARSRFAASPVSTVYNCVGLYGQNCGSPASAGPSSTPGSLQPEFSWNQRTTLSFQSIDVSLNWRHLSGFKVEPGVTTFSGTIGSGALAGQTFNFGRIPSYDYFDLATRFAVGDHLDLTFTVSNLFDRKPPVVGGTVGSTSFNSGNTYPSTYDALGRRVAATATVKF
ncbi:MAG: TonB-dependent receptor [Sphingomonas sp. 28-66-16]|nr:MAG: TonB-dependent receptor [Sphingomonas sp. 28-66-16]